MGVHLSHRAAILAAPDAPLMRPGRWTGAGAGFLRISGFNVAVSLACPARSPICAGNNNPPFAEAAIDNSARNAHLAIARHFYSLAEEAISQQPGKTQGASLEGGRPLGDRHPVAAD
jgi:hypothetical protein